MNPALLTLLILVGGNLVGGDDVQVLTKAINGFSENLYEKLALNTPNAVYSPFSIHSALSMTSLGAQGETATELSKTLGVTNLTANSLPRAYHNLIVELNSATDVKLNTANAIYVNPNSAIETQFVNDVKADYLGTATNIDLAAAGGPEKEINDFVSKKTEGLITNILPPGSVNADTALILVNTIFFNGTWKAKFETSKTHKQDFQQLGGAKSQVDMMYDERIVSIKRNVDGVDVAALPFIGGRFSLYIALPHTVDGITALERSIVAPGKLAQLVDGLTPTRVRLSIPKFKIESNFELIPALQQLGIVQAFQDRANFQGISRGSSLHIDKVIHKAVIEVKETGTVAAAATAIGLVPLVIISPPTDSFTADHPFIFFIWDNEAKLILFQGKFSG